MSRNIVLVTYDSLRADHCGFMGYDRATTPTLDAMAEEGVVYENAIASGVPTIASMTAVMTGRHSLASPEIGFNTEQREQVTSRPTIAEVLSDAGYATGGLSPNPPASSYFGFDSGFDWFEDFLAEDRGIAERAWNRIFERSIEGGSLSTYLRLARNVVSREEVLRPWEAYYDQLMAWRESVDEPYFLWILLLEPHHPWFPPSEYQQWSSRTDTYRSFQHYWEMLNSDWQPEFDETTHQRLVDLYDDSIRYGDAFLDRLQADLADDDPVFIVHADHGEEFGEHGRYGHQPHLTEELIHVPLVVSGREATGRISRPVGLTQLAPTIADTADVPHPFAAEPLDSDAQPWVTAKVFAEGHRRAAVRTEGEKYLSDHDHCALYDLHSEAGEGRDCSTDQPGVTAAFEQLLARHTNMEQERRAIDTARKRLATEETI